MDLRDLSPEGKAVVVCSAPPGSVAGIVTLCSSYFSSPRHGRYRSSLEDSGYILRLGQRHVVLERRKEARSGTDTFGLEETNNTASQCLIVI